MQIDSRRRTLMVTAGAVALGSVVAGSAALAATAKPKPRVIKVIAKKFVFVPDEIRLKQGETVTFQLTAPEVPMGFNLADFNLRADVMPGKTTSIDFTPDKAGTFIYLCDVFCGTGHEEMNGTLIVT
jgi:cytochrome c oxidase subunit II